MSSQVNPTPKNPLAYHLRNYNNAQKKQRQPKQYMTGGQVVAEARRSISSSDIVQLPKSLHTGASDSSVSMRNQNAVQVYKNVSYPRMVTLKNQTPAAVRLGEGLAKGASRFYSNKYASLNIKHQSPSSKYLNASIDSERGEGLSALANRRIPINLNKSALAVSHK